VRLPLTVIEASPLALDLSGRPELEAWVKRPENQLTPGTWGILSVPCRGRVDRGLISRPHWVNGLRDLSEDRARQQWWYWSKAHRAGALLVCAPVLYAKTSPTPAGQARQLELAHAAPDAFEHHQLCSACGGPVELYPGRAGRPRSQCETCAPPTWPRKGETWWLDGDVEVHVLGSQMATTDTGHRQRRVRYRRVGRGLAEELTGAAWRQRAGRTRSTPRPPPKKPRHTAMGPIGPTIALAQQVEAADLGQTRTVPPPLSTGASA
jgi:hypothetical protein